MQVTQGRLRSMESWASAGRQSQCESWAASDDGHQERWDNPHTGEARVTRATALPGFSTHSVLGFSLPGSAVASSPASNRELGTAPLDLAAEGDPLRPGWAGAVLPTQHPAEGPRPCWPMWGTSWNSALLLTESSGSGGPGRRQAPSLRSGCCSGLCKVSRRRDG